jgi:hypothetical protein
MATNPITAGVAGAIKARFGSAPDLLGIKAAQAHARAFNAAYPDEAVTKPFDFGPTACFMTLDAAKAWFYAMTPDAREAVLRTEVVMGWFQSDDEDDDTQDADGDFMSTPGCSGYDNLEDVWDDLEHCSRAGLLSVDAPSAIK